MSKPTGKLCIKHGGDYDGPEAFWYCDTCSRSGINKCDCGGHARYFGEALMCSVSCEECGESVAYVGSGVDIRKKWNEGVRGLLD